MLFCVHIKCNRNNKVAAVMAKEDMNKRIKKERNIKVNIKQVHAMFGHMDEECTRKIAKHLGIKITIGMLKVCEDCAEAKAKRKKVAKVSDHEISKEPNGRIFLEISSIKKPKNAIDIKRVNSLENHGG